MQSTSNTQKGKDIALIKKQKQNKTHCSKDFVYILNKLNQVWDQISK